MSKPALPDLDNKQERDEILAYAKQVKCDVEFDSPEYDLLNDTLPHMMAHIERLTNGIDAGQANVTRNSRMPIVAPLPV